MSDYKALLQKPADSFKKPPTWAAGTYMGRIVKTEFDTIKSKKDGTEMGLLRVTAQPYAMGEDVDASYMQEHNIDLTRRTFRFDYFLTAEALWRLTAFMKTCGLVTEGRSQMEILPELISCDVMLTIKQIPNRDQTEIVNTCDRGVGTARTWDEVVAEMGLQGKTE